MAEYSEEQLRRKSHLENGGTIANYDRSIKSTPRRGDRVFNGAVILDIKRTSGDGWIVLCFWADESPLHPFVTWWAYWSETGELRTSMGHYYDQLSQAIVDFDNRS